MKSCLKSLVLFLSCLLLLTACGGGGSSDSAGGSTGTLDLSLTDAATEDYRAIYVTVERVDVSSDGGSWQTVATPGGTYDLLSLVNGVTEQLGVSELGTGHYNQMRLILGKTPEAETLNLLDAPHPFANYLIDQTDTVHALKVPSGFNTGIKIVHGFDINADQTTALLLDFDASRSVVKAGQSGQYLLKPTIKVLNTSESAVVSGLVSDGIAGLEGALVSAQVDHNDLTLDAADRVEIVRSTLSAADDVTTAEDETGRYQLELPAGSYNLVAYLSGYQPLCVSLDLSSAASATQDFTLVDTETGTVAGTVAVTGASENQHVTIAFRQTGICADAGSEITVKTLEIAVPGEYAVELPVGSYEAVASTDGLTTVVTPLEVTANATTAHNIAF